MALIGQCWRYLPLVGWYSMSITMRPRNNRWCHQHHQPPLQIILLESIYKYCDTLCYLMKGWVCGLLETFPANQSDLWMAYNWPITAQHESPRLHYPVMVGYKSQWAPSSQTHYTPHHHLVPSLPAVQGLDLGRNQIMENQFQIRSISFFVDSNFMDGYGRKDIYSLCLWCL